MLNKVSSIVVITLSKKGERDKLFSDKKLQQIIQRLFKQIFHSTHTENYILTCAHDREITINTIRRRTADKKGGTEY